MVTHFSLSDQNSTFLFNLRIIVKTFFSTPSSAIHKRILQRRWHVQISWDNIESNKALSVLNAVDMWAGLVNSASMNCLSVKSFIASYLHDYGFGC